KNCPMTVVMTSQVIKTIEIGEILEVVADDKASECNFPSFCRANGHEIMKESMEEGIYRIFIKRMK
ncbi:MAG: sulfurtransferase TusA family protein, partial [Candidatus Hodarchaeales archaeon]